MGLRARLVRHGCASRLAPVFCAPSGRNRRGALGLSLVRGSQPPGRSTASSARVTPCPAVRSPQGQAAAEGQETRGLSICPPSALPARGEISRTRLPRDGGSSPWLGQAPSLRSGALIRISTAAGHGDYARALYAARRD